MWISSISTSFGIFVDFGHSAINSIVAWECEIRDYVWLNIMLTHNTTIIFTNVAWLLSQWSKATSTDKVDHSNV